MTVKFYDSNNRAEQVKLNGVTEVIAIAGDQIGIGDTVYTIMEDQNSVISAYLLSQAPPANTNMNIGYARTNANVDENIQISILAKNIRFE